MENANNKCCHDDVKLLKLQSDQQQTYFDFQCQSPAAPAQEFDLIHPGLIISGDEPSVSNHSPPGDTSPSLCILHCVFRL